MQHFRELGILAVCGWLVIAGICQEWVFLWIVVGLVLILLVPVVLGLGFGV